MTQFHDDGDRVSHREAVVCGTCRKAHGTLTLYTSGKLDADFACDCRQKWLEEGRSPWYGVYGPGDRAREDGSGRGENQLY
jgi:hypothetical protein